MRTLRGRLDKMPCPCGGEKPCKEKEEAKIETPQPVEEQSVSEDEREKEEKDS